MRLVLLVAVAGLICVHLVGCGTPGVQAESDSRPNAKVVRGDINTALLITLWEKIDHLIELIESPRTLNGNPKLIISPPVKLVPINGTIVNADNDTKLAVINVGTKGGVERGYVFDVTRGGSYIARLEIETVYDNAAAGTIKFTTPCESVRSGDQVTNTLH